MAFDGITVFALEKELKRTITDARIDKIHQPNRDEIMLQIRGFGKQYRLLLTANASNTKFHFTEQKLENPAAPPLFCMVLRKHLQGGKIVDIKQYGFDRIIELYIESLNEMGDLSVKRLIFEIMGKHSNICLVDENGIICDCLKHIGHDKSSVREMLPSRQYMSPPHTDKINPLKCTKEDFAAAIKNNASGKIQELIYKTVMGISPVFSSELCFRAGIDCSDDISLVSLESLYRVYDALKSILDDISEGKATPCIYSDNDKYIDFSPIEMQQFSMYRKKDIDSMSPAVEEFYKNRDLSYRLKQKTSDIRKIVASNLERCLRKRDLWQKNIKQTENRDRLRLLGELITANIYAIKKGESEVEVVNFYSENQEKIKIKLDPEKTPNENAQAYFKKYNKQKRTYEAALEQTAANEDEIEYLEGVLTSVDNCVTEADVKQLRSELNETGYLKKQDKAKGPKTQGRASAMHFVSSDGYDIYIGKNNTQNDELTIKTAKPKDLWLHTKNIPGSHVIVIYKGEEIPERTIFEAACLAAVYSKAKNDSKVAVDYTEKRNVKKPNGSKPGFVIYETNKTAYVTPDKTLAEKLGKH
ncbi:MAG TPA: fibronectin/fibrinogen-binding protein [Lachnospiraceae bacterium]|nr:fibronectin/fibrinogen-binding protein [Lachnospiraceae bacterium]